MTKLSKHPKIETLVSSEVTRRYTVKLSGAEIVRMLAGLGCYTLDIPPNAEIKFLVPGGGDWSNTAIDVDDENPVWVEWKTVEHTDSRT